MVLTEFRSPAPGPFDDLDVAFEDAAVLQPLGSLQEARDLLAAGNSAIERFAPSFLCLLTSMALYSRMVATIAPRRRFRGATALDTPRSLAGVGSLVGRAGRALQDRCDLRLHILAEGFATAGRYLLRVASTSIKGDRFAGWRQDEQIADIRADFGMLARAAVTDLEALLASMPDRRPQAMIGVTGRPRPSLTLVTRAPDSPTQS